MKVKQLREMLEKLDDDTNVVVYAQCRGYCSANARVESLEPGDPFEGLWFDTDSDTEAYSTKLAVIIT